MKRFFITVFVSCFIVYGSVGAQAVGGYVFSTDVGSEGSINYYFHTKGYMINQGTETEPYWQKDVAFKYGFRWVVLKNLEVLFDPPLLRYHFGGGPGGLKNGISFIGLGDMDIGAKYVFNNSFALAGFLRVATGNSDMPVWDTWCPKFSLNSEGYSFNAIFSETFFDKVKGHFNIGWLHKIGSYGEVPDNRIPIGFKLESPWGVFIEWTTDINRYSVYGKDISVNRNPKRLIIGSGYDCGQGVKLLANLEHGTWGTGDPPMWNWHYGYIEEVTQWNINIGAIIPIGVPRTVPSPIAGIVGGRVLNRITNEPISVKLEIPKLSAEIQTDESGKYQLILPAGAYTVVIKLSDYESHTQEINVKNGESVNVDFILTPVE